MSPPVNAGLDSVCTSRVCAMSARPDRAADARRLRSSDEGGVGMTRSGTAARRRRVAGAADVLVRVGTAGRFVERPFAAIFEADPLRFEGFAARLVRAVA